MVLIYPVDDMIRQHNLIIQGGKSVNNCVILLRFKIDADNVN